MHTAKALNVSEYMPTGFIHSSGYYPRKLETLVWSDNDSSWTFVCATAQPYMRWAGISWRTMGRLTVSGCDCVFWVSSPSIGSGWEEGEDRHNTSALLFVNVTAHSDLKSMTTSRREACIYKSFSPISFWLRKECCVVSDRLWVRNVVLSFVWFWGFHSEANGLSPWEKIRHV